MSAANPTYLYHCPYGYYFRLRVPLDLKGYVGKTELRYSLRTNTLSEAKSKARLLAGKTQHLFRTLRNKQVSILSKKEIHQMLQAFVREALEFDEYVRVTSKVRNYDSVDNQLDAITFLIDDCQEALSLNTTHRYSERTANKLLEQFGKKIDKDSDDYRILCRELAKANISVLKIIQKRETGDYSQEVSPYPAAESPETPKQSWEPLITVIDAYLAEKKGTVHSRTLEKAIGYLNILSYYFGPETPITSIQHKEMREYKEFLKKLPTGFTKTAKYKDWTVQDVLNNDDASITMLSDNSINHYLGETISFFTYAVRHGYVEKNYAEGLKIPNSRAPHEQRDILTIEDLNKLFTSKEYATGSHKSPYHYWLPILALFTGARLEELCQLHVNDVKKIDSLWCLDITEEGSTEDNPKRLKNRASDRLIPLHPFIVESLKFIDYIKEMQQKAEVRAFPDIPYSASEERWGAVPSKWFGSVDPQKL